MKRVLFFPVFLCALWLSAAPRLSEFGGLELPGSSWLVTFINNNWVAFSYDGHWRDKVFQREKSGETDTAAFRVTIPGLPEGKLRLALEPEGEASYRYRAEVAFSEPAQLASLSLETRLPVDKYAGVELKINGQAFALPREKKPGMLVQRRASELEIPAGEGTVSLRGDFELHIQDSRTYNLPTYTIRIRMTPGYGKITNATLDLTLQCRAGEDVPLDLRDIANAGFADETAGDGKGGWTDQGPANDLRMLKPGTQLMDRMPFAILDPEKNGGKSCVMLAGSARPGFPEEVCGSRLYLLHAIAWPGQEVGSVKVVYRDGSADTFEVRGGREVGNWWAPVACPNGEVVWTAENATAYVGLFRSRFPLRERPLARIEFHSARRSVWGIVAATVSSRDLPRLRHA